MPGLRKMTQAHLPSPDAAAQGISALLVERIDDEISRAGGWIGFDRFMELALYAPGLGYYAAGARKFGPAGDFVTAPEMTPLFARALARQVAQVMARSAARVTGFDQTPQLTTFFADEGRDG